MNSIQQFGKLPPKKFCLQYDLDEDGLEKICRRLNVPFPTRHTGKDWPKERRSGFCRCLKNSSAHTKLFFTREMMLPTVSIIDKRKGAPGPNQSRQS
ncbi:hypothetical protein [Chryseolinea sp. H1M3-3]|uniref:hypothetical protein n=1 Tax=Chryseolinea sp. H1M3-3 TaxID=3034144 RepID=UPI0023ED99CD|nr:hypothetical protein [Chryseolinea sp. H1M3-3]